jgi:NAD(P)-dependent dehydrogenase (short-subunit alcohol dehydrogenase family)
MSENPIEQYYQVSGKVVAITGGGGELCGGMARMLGKAGLKVAVMDLSEEKAQKVVDDITAAGGDALALACDVMDKASTQDALAKIETTYGPVDILINGAGGNHPMATTSAEKSFFDLDIQAFNKVFGLNFIGTLVPSQVFGRAMAARGSGCIVNIASMNAIRPLTRIPAYSAAKAAVANFTQWLAVHMAQEYTPAIRVNALAPGFFLTGQNHYLLIDEKTGGMTPRGKAIMDHIPAKRLGTSADLYGSLLWLISPASEYVSGIVVPVDGGFSAYSGV